MALYYGNTESTSSGNSSFRIVCEYTASNQGNGYYQYKYRFYVQVIKGNFYGTNLSTSWGSNVTIRGAGKYGYSGYSTKNVAYGSKFTLGTTAYAQYTSSSTYRSQISGSTAIASVPRPKYTVAYNANGGSGAPSKQTKTYGITLKLSSSKPTRTGYSFQGWGTTSTDTSVNYAAGAKYTANAGITLYAIWKANTYTVKFDANGGSGAPSNQTKTYGVNLTLSSTKPTRTNYNFLGWGTSASSTTVAYAAGATYSSNAAITLYAIWELAYTKPRITNFTVDRCDRTTGEFKDDGTGVRIRFDWETDKPAASTTVYFRQSGASAWRSSSSTASGTSGSVDLTITTITFDTEYEYEFRVEVTDSVDSSELTNTVPAMVYLLDCLRGGKGLAIGKPASREGLDIAFDTMFDVSKALKAGDSTFMQFQSNERPYFTNHVGLANAVWLQGQLASGSFTNILRMNAEGQVEINWTSGGLKGRVMKEIWSGNWSSGTITVPELPYYNAFMFAFYNNDQHILAFRDIEDGTSSGSITGVGGQAHMRTNNCIVIAGICCLTPDGPSGTKLELSNAYMFNLVYGSTLTANGGADMRVIKIYGVM